MIPVTACYQAILAPQSSPLALLLVFTGSVQARTSVC